MRNKLLILFLLSVLMTGAAYQTDPVIVAAGDIAACGLPFDEKTADLLDNIDGAVLALGDTVYPDGTADQFAQCYDPTWGRHKKRTYPTLGNHEYNTKGATGYFDYFGARARPEGYSYYSFDIGTWHIISLNSNIDARPVGNQGMWLRADLEAHKVKCTLVFFHHPLFSSRPLPDGNLRMKQFWEVLYEYGVDVILNGDVHYYERMMPQTPDGIADPEHGIRQFIVGTGGASLAPNNGASAAPTSEVRSNATHGVLKMILHPDGYSWQFIPIEGGTFRDSGISSCVDPRPTPEVTVESTP
ncbi:MAG: metallophosphoesterase [Anaerolineae bacterium]|nr:metallophosphoesterase [Anaerolineae bacterium]